LLQLNGGTFEVANGGMIELGSREDTTVTVENSTMIINGGVVRGQGHETIAIFLSESTLNVIDGEITAAESISTVNNSVVNISGGTVKGEICIGGTVLSISGGTVEMGSSRGRGYSFDSRNSTVNITGGSVSWVGRTQNRNEFELRYGSVINIAEGVDVAISVGEFFVDSTSTINNNGRIILVQGGGFAQDSVDRISGEGIIIGNPIIICPCGDNCRCCMCCPCRSLQNPPDELAVPIIEPTETLNEIPITSTEPNVSAEPPIVETRNVNVPLDNHNHGVLPNELPDETAVGGVSLEVEFNSATLNKDTATDRETNTSDNNDSNPQTGITFAIIPCVITGLAMFIIRKKKQ
jgi:hypothetical protein